MVEAQEQPRGQLAVAFVLSLLAGLWMLGMGGYMGGFGMGGMMGGMGRGGMHGYAGMYGWNGMNGWMWGRGMHTFGLWSPWFGALAGILVIVGASILYSKPAQARTWGTIILVVSVLDFFLGMGGLVAGVLGVIGGAVAIGA